MTYGIVQISEEEHAIFLCISNYLASNKISYLNERKIYFLRLIVLSEM